MELALQPTCISKFFPMEFFAAGLFKANTTTPLNTCQYKYRIKKSLPGVSSSCSSSTTKSLADSVELKRVSLGVERVAATSGMKHKL